MATFSHSFSRKHESSFAESAKMGPVENKQESANPVTSSSLSSAEIAFCGAMSGLVSRFVISPLDVVKIRLQLQSERKQWRYKQAHQVDGHLKTPTPKPKYNGMLQGMAVIMREEGIKGLWKGNMSAEYLYLTYGAVQFYTYQRAEQLIQQLDRRKRLPKGAQAVISGAIAGTVATAATYPFDLLRTRFAAQGEVKTYTGVLQSFSHIYKTEGWQGFYRGLVPALIQIIPYMGLMFGSYDVLKRSMTKVRESTGRGSGYSATEDMLCGALAGLISKTGVFPLDTVRKRLQVQGPSRQTYVISNLPEYSKSSWQALRRIVANEGFLALYKGLIPGIIKTGPASAVTFLVYGKTKDVLEHLKQYSL